MKIADVHAHVFPDKLAEKAAHSIGNFYETPMYRPASLDNLVQEEQRAGISRCLISNSAVTPQQVHNINTFLAECVKTQPDWIAFGSIFPGMDGYEEELDRMLQLGLRGLKIHPDFQKLPIDDPSAIDTYRAAAKRGMPVLFHMGDDRYDFSSPQRLLNLLRKVPDLRVIAAHFGGWRAWQLSYETPMPETVVYDTSSSLPLIPRDLVLRMLERFGPQRLLFGSDFPMWEPKAMVEQTKALGLDEQTLEAVLYGNFMKFFALQDGARV